MKGWSASALTQKHIPSIVMGCTIKKGEKRMTRELLRSEGVIVFGDSLAGGEMGHEKIGFPARLGLKLRRGRSGLSTHPLIVLGEMTRESRIRIPEIRRYLRRRNVVVVWTGMKDTGLTKEGRVPLVEGTTFYENMRAVVNRVPKNVPVFLLGYYAIDSTKTNPWPITGYRYDPGRTLDFNAILLAVAEAHTNTTFVPTRSLIKPSDLTPDGIHLTPRGYSKIVRVLAPKILQAFDSMP